MGSMLLLRQTATMGQTAGPQVSTPKTEIPSPIHSSSCGLPASSVRMATTSFSSSPLGLSSNLGLFRRQATRASTGHSNLSTISSYCMTAAADSSRLVKGKGFAGTGLCRLVRPTLREVGGVGQRKQTGLVMAGGSQYDGVLQEERYSENGASASTFEDLLDSSSSLEASSSAEEFLEETQSAKRTINAIEEKIERAIFDFRFLTLFGVVGSLLGAVLCFLKGCLFVGHSYREYFRACFGGVPHTSRVILYLVEAVDVYLMGTVMLIFGMGLYELFVSSLEVPDINCGSGGAARSTVCGSNLFGLFRLRERPKWLEIRSLDELKTKLGHVIVMILLVGMFEKSKKVIVQTSMDFLCFSASILLSSGALFLLSMLHSTHVNNSQMKHE